MGHIKRNLQIVLLAGSLIGTAAIAQQHEEHKSADPKLTANSMDMSGCPHMKAAGLADQLLTSFAGIEKEKDMARLQKKLSDHGKLLKQLKATTDEKCPMMEMKSGGMMGGGMMGHEGMNMPGMQTPAPSK